MRRLMCGLAAGVLVGLAGCGDPAPDTKDTGKLAEMQKQQQQHADDEEKAMLKQQSKKR